MAFDPNKTLPIDEPSDKAQEVNQSNDQRHQADKLKKGAAIAAGVVAVSGLTAAAVAHGSELLEHVQEMGSEAAHNIENLVGIDHPNTSETKVGDPTTKAPVSPHGTAEVEPVSPPLQATELREPHHHQLHHSTHEPISAPDHTDSSSQPVESPWHPDADVFHLTVDTPPVLDPKAIGIHVETHTTSPDVAPLMTGSSQPLPETHPAHPDSPMHPATTADVATNAHFNEPAPESHSATVQEDSGLHSLGNGFGQILAGIIEPFANTPIGMVAKGVGNLVGNLIHPHSPKEAEHPATSHPVESHQTAVNPVNVLPGSTVPGSQPHSADPSPTVSQAPSPSVPTPAPSAVANQPTAPDAIHQAEVSDSQSNTLPTPANQSQTDHPTDQPSVAPDVQNPTVQAHTTTQPAEPAPTTDHLTDQPPASSPVDQTPTDHPVEQNQASVDSPVSSEPDQPAIAPVNPTITDQTVRPPVDQTQPAPSTPIDSVIDHSQDQPINAPAEQPADHAQPTDQPIITPVEQGTIDNPVEQNQPVVDTPVEQSDNHPNDQPVITAVDLPNVTPIEPPTDHSQLTDQPLITAVEQAPTDHSQDQPSDTEHPADLPIIIPVEHQSNDQADNVPVDQAITEHPAYQPPIVEPISDHPTDQGQSIVDTTEASVPDQPIITPVDQPSDQLPDNSHPDESANDHSIDTIHDEAPIPITIDAPSEQAHGTMDAGEPTPIVIEDHTEPADAHMDNGNQPTDIHETPAMNGDTDIHDSSADSHDIPDNLHI